MIGRNYSSSEYTITQFSQVYEPKLHKLESTPEARGRVKGLIYCILASKRNYSTLWKSKEGERMNCGVDYVDQDFRQ